MSQINVNRIKDSNKGAPDFPSGVNVGGITSTVTLGVTNLNPTNLNVLGGVCTATTLDGNLLATGTPTLGLGVTINTSGVNISGVATAGIVSATTLYGNGANITGIALTVAPLNYNPAAFGADVSISPGIGLTFNQGVKAGSGEVTLRQVGAAGTVVQTWGVGSSITYSKGDEISLSLVSNLAYDSVYHLSYPSGAFTNIGGDVSYVGTGYTFSVKPLQYQLWVIGDNSEGQLGQSTVVKYSSPVQVPGTTWSSVFNTGESVRNNVSVIKSDGTLWVWGDNYRGSLGINKWDEDQSSPVQVPGTTWAHSTEGRSLLRTKTDGTLWASGYNENVGQLGQNNRTDYSSPVQIPGTDWDSSSRFKISSGEAGMSAIKTNGTLWTWGINENGMLGQNQAQAQLTAASSPVQVPGTTWSQISFSRGSMATAIKTDGTLWAWGRNNHGQLAQNNPTNNDRSSPVQIPGTTWKYARGGNKSVLAVKTDGTLWSWGYNRYGALGINDVADHSSPTQIPGTTWDVALTSGGEFTSIATKTDGTLWGWGNNSNGQLGQNSVVKYSSPVQIPGTSWHDQISVTDESVFVLKEV